MPRAAITILIVACLDPLVGFLDTTPGFSATLLQSDDFNDGVWDYNAWYKYTDDGEKVGEAGGAAWFAKYYGAPACERGMKSTANVEVHAENDFSVSIDYDLTWDCPWHDYWRLTFDYMYLHVVANGVDAYVERRIDQGGSDASFHFYFDGVKIGQISAAHLAESPEAMKLERVGDRLAGYCRVGAGAW